MAVKCSTCGAPATPGVTICEYCGEALDFGGAAPQAQAPGMSPAPGAAPGVAPGAEGAPPGPGGGQAASPVAAAPGRTTRALAPDGYWYPVAASPIEGGKKFLVRFDDGYQATMNADEVRPPCDAHFLRPGTRVVGESENLYRQGTVVGETQGGWEVSFDDGSSAILPNDRIAVYDTPAEPLPPGTRCLAQGSDGRWYDGQIFSGADQDGRQSVRLDEGGTAQCLPSQLVGTAGPDVAKPGSRVLGIGPEYQHWYPGTVQQVTQAQALVRFDDGDEEWMGLNQIRRII